MHPPTKFEKIAASNALSGINKIQGQSTIEDNCHLPR